MNGRTHFNLCVWLLCLACFVLAPGGIAETLQEYHVWLPVPDLDTAYVIAPKGGASTRNVPDTSTLIPFPYPASGVTSVSGTANQIDSSGGTTPVLSLSSTLVFPGTGAVRLPNGTTAQRPSAAAGQVRYSTTRSTFEQYDGTNWLESMLLTPALASTGDMAYYDSTTKYWRVVPNVTTGDVIAFDGAAPTWQQSGLGIQYPNPGTTTINGSTSGQAFWNQPFQGAGYKKVILILNAFDDAGETINYTTAFTYPPATIANTTGLVPTVNLGSIVLGASGGASGVIILEGF